MSYISFLTSDQTEFKVSGSELFYASVLTSKAATDVLANLDYQQLAPWISPKPAAFYQQNVQMLLEHTFGVALSDCFVFGNNPTDVAANTVFVSRCDAEVMLVRLTFWSEGHILIEEQQRHWVANVIEQGLVDGTIRRTVNGYSQGWEDVIDLLRSEDIVGPVITSTSHATGIYDLDLIESYGSQQARSQLVPTPQWIKDNAERCEHDEDWINESWLNEHFYAQSFEAQWDSALDALRHKAEKLSNHRLHPDTFRTTYAPTAIELRDKIVQAKARQ